jgi:hypothetical protein
LEPVTGQTSQNAIGDWLEHLRPWLCRALPAVAVLCFLAWCYVAVRADFSWDDAEPEVLSHAWLLANGEPIYKGITSPPYNIAIYPPLYYWIVALPMKWTGLSFLPAKLVSFLSALAIGWALASAAGACGKSRRAAVFAAFALFLIPAFLYNSVRAHVQMMAVALSVWSFVLLLRNRKPGTLVISGLLAVLAMYTKQTMVAVPLAAATWLALRDRRRLATYVAVCAVAGLAPLFWLQKATNGLFLLDTVRLAKLTYVPQNIPLIFIHHAGPIFLFIGLALAASWRRFRRGAWDPLDCYLTWVLVVTVVSLGRPGAHGQYVLELLVVTMLYLVCLFDFRAMSGRAPLVSLQILFLFLYAPLFVFVEEGMWDMAANRAAPKVYSTIKTGSGPILSQQGSFALFGRGEIYLQLFHFSRLWRAGLWDPSPLLREIENKKFSWFISEFPIEEEPKSESDYERFAPELLRTLRGNYRRVQTEYPYYLYAPKAGGL